MVSRLRLILRILVPFGALFLFPWLTGVEIYAAFVLQFFFFVSAIGLVTSPIEHMLIRLRSRSGYDLKLTQLFWAYLSIASTACLAASLSYILFLGAVAQSGAGLLSILAVAVAAIAYQIGYFLKFFRSDWYYYYAESINYIVIALFCALVLAWGSLDLLVFSCISALAYLAVVATRLSQMVRQSVFKWPRPRRIVPMLLLAYRTTTLPSLLGVLVKRSDSLFLPALPVTSETVLVYRLIRNFISSAPLVGNLYAQDVWMARRVSNLRLPPATFAILTVLMLLVLAALVWLYLMWTGISNPLQLADIVCIGFATAAAVYLAFNAVKYNLAFQEGRYKIVLACSAPSFIIFLALVVLGLLGRFDFTTYLLVLVFLPQLVNGACIRVLMNKQHQTI